MVYLGKRQDWDDDDGYDDGYDDGGWWYSDTAEAIKWAIVAAIFFAIVLFFAGGYFHAQRRIKKGQAPLRYHRWFLPRSQRVRYTPQQQFTFYHHQQNPYEMQPYAAPPPGMFSWYHLLEDAKCSAYHHNEMPPPPRYEPPQGASKMNQDQQYAAPPGPPPAGESSRSSPPSPVSPLQEQGQSLEHQNNFHTQPDEAAPLPPRPQPSSRSWNPLKRFK
ncbi:MAG: hypothetical protein Q9219_002021 [cf. Caloplaca sp. 3 TL-2023]